MPIPRRFLRFDPLRIPLLSASPTWRPATASHVGQDDRSRRRINAARFRASLVQLRPASRRALRPRRLIRQLNGPGPFCPTRPQSRGPLAKGHGGRRARASRAAASCNSRRRCSLSADGRRRAKNRARGRVRDRAGLLANPRLALVAALDLRRRRFGRRHRGAGRGRLWRGPRHHVVLRRRRRDYDHRVRVRRELSLSWSARRDGESEARGRAKDLWYHHRLPPGGRVAGPSPSRPFNRRNARLSMGGRETGERRVVSRAPSSPGGRGSRASVRSATPSATPAPPRSSARQCPRGRSRAGRRRH